ncbi:MAG: aldehyde dehydrogenase, partial [Candidatus Eremiobacteraeota bacterium]|nr:aldehyde dehydrogenase [Candidatus Eremiobacteraeota bacterium]
KLYNAGFNCIGSQVLILPEEWHGTPKLLQEVQKLLTLTGARPAYYPGAESRRQRMRSYGDTGSHPSVVRITQLDSAAFREEAFCDVLACTSLRGDLETFLTRAVALANDSMWGTLGANMIVHPKTMQRSASVIDAAIDALRYGTIGVNAWTGVGYCLADVPWGAYPGHLRTDIQSGTGVVHNALFFARSEKSVVYGPFRPFPRSVLSGERSLLPKPPWFVTHRNAASVGERLFRFQMNHSPTNLAAVVTAALRG